MSKKEIAELRRKIEEGLAQSQWQMLFDKMKRGEKIVTMKNGKACELSARTLYHQLYGKAQSYEEALNQD